MIANIDSLKPLVEKAQEILVLLPQNPGPDSIASALSLGLSLEQAGKAVVVACATPIDFTEYPLVNREKIVQKIGNKNLVISLKVANRDCVEKVSYNLDEENKVFNLIISPKKGAQPLASDAVSYSLAGARADLIFTVGAASFDDLGTLFVSETNLFTETTTVAINRLEPNPFATHHIANPLCSSIAEEMVGLLESLNLPLDSAVSSNLLASIDVVTNKLQMPSASAATFDAVAKLIRAGGTRIMLAIPQTESTPIKQPVSMPAPASIQVDGVEPEEIPEEWLTPKILKAPKTN